MRNRGLTCAIQNIPDKPVLYILSAAYASSLEDFIHQTQPKLWLHGHTHHSWNYNIGNTQIHCNPRGYPNEAATFDPKLVLTL